jgi:hypothetical protein
MMGAGANVFAVWAYCISKGYEREGIVRLNPAMLSAVIGLSEDQAWDAISYLCSPDSASVSMEDDGARIVHLSGFEYAIVNWEKYQELIKRELRLARDRERKREERSRNKNVQENGDGSRNVPEGSMGEQDSLDMSVEQRTVRDRPKKSPIREDERREDIHTSPSPPAVDVPVSSPRRKRKPVGYSEDFEAFWSLYPRQEAKKPASVSWERLSDADKALAMEAIPKHAALWAREGREKKVMPHATTWLNQERWTDRIDDETRKETTNERIAREIGADVFDVMTYQAHGQGVPRSKEEVRAFIAKLPPRDSA